MQTIPAHLQQAIQSLRQSIQPVLSNFSDGLKRSTHTITQSAQSNTSSLLEEILTPLEQQSSTLHKQLHSINNLETILIAAASTILLLYLITKLKTIKAILIDWLQSVPRTLGTIKKLFHKPFYRTLATAIDKKWSLAAYKILLWIRDSFNRPLFFRRPDLLIDKILHHAARFRNKLRPLAKIILFFIPGLRLTKPASQQIISALMDEGKQPAEQLPLPKAICDALSLKTLTDIPERWQKMTTQVITRWEEGLVSGLLIEGGNGSGKTAYLNWLKKNYKKYKPQTFTATRGKNLLKTPIFRSLLKLKTEKVAQLKKQIITIDDIEQLFLRRVGGYHNISQLLNLIEKTKSRILWIVSANSVFCSFMRNIQPIDLVFPFHITAPYFTAEEIQTIIENNLRKENFQLRVLMDKNTYQDIAKKIKRKQFSPAAAGNYLKKLFFEKCYECGIDNLHFHLYYFKRSIRSIKNNTISLTLPEFFKLPEKQLQDQNTLHLLYALFLHRALNKEQLIQLLLLPEEKVTLTLSILHQHNLIKKTEDNYSIFPPIYHQLLTHLKSKNISRGSYD